jgi:uncharacterized protein
MATPEEPGLVSAVVLKLAAHCNLNCSYCYVYNHQDTGFRDRPRFISDEIYEATLQRIADYCDSHAPHSIFITFHGGEPTLVGHRRMAKLASRADEVLGDRLAALLLQTNGTLIDESWISVLRRHRMAVGVSLDGPPEVHDAVRVNHAGRGSYRSVVRGIRRLQEAGLRPSILSVVNPGHNGASVYTHFRELGIERMNFLLPDCSHDSKAEWYGGFGETPVADFLIPIFDAWVAEDDPVVEVRIFGDLIRTMLGGHAGNDQFGNLLMNYLVVETDGAIEALDALRVCEHGLAASGLNVLRDGFDDLARGAPLLFDAVHRGIPLSKKCLACSEVDVCGGGYLPHRYSRARGFNNPSVWCDDILAVIDHVRRWLAGQSLSEAPGAAEALTM